MLGRRSLKELVIAYRATIKRVLIVTEVALPSNTGSSFTLQTNDELLDKLRHHTTVHSLPHPRLFNDATTRSGLPPSYFHEAYSAKISDALN